MTASLRRISWNLAVWATWPPLTASHHCIPGPDGRHRPDEVKAVLSDYPPGRSRGYDASGPTAERDVRPRSVPTTGGSTRFRVPVLWCDGSRISPLFVV